MVHGIETLKALNAPNKDRREPTIKKLKIPDRISLHPASAREYINRPWTKKEQGTTGISPFENRPGCIERLQ